MDTVVLLVGRSQSKAWRCLRCLGGRAYTLACLLVLACGNGPHAEELSGDIAISGIQVEGGQAGQPHSAPGSGGYSSSAAGSRPQAGSSGQRSEVTVGGCSSSTLGGGGSSSDSSPPSPFAWLSEVKIDPPGTDGNFEFIELRGKPGSTLSGYWLASLEGDADSNRGQIDNVIDLSICGGEKCRFDTNGLILLIPDSTATPAPSGAAWRLTPEIAKGGIENGSNSLLLGTGAMPEAGVDWDIDDDGTIELPRESTVVDAIAWTDGGSNDMGYANRLLGPKPKPQAVWMCEDPPGTRNWRWGQLQGESATLNVDVAHAFPAGLSPLELSPGATNRCEVPTPATAGAAGTWAGTGGSGGSADTAGATGVGGSLGANCGGHPGGAGAASTSPSSISSNTTSVASAGATTTARTGTQPNPQISEHQGGRAGAANSEGPVPAPNATTSTIGGVSTVGGVSFVGCGGGQASAVETPPATTLTNGGCSGISSSAVGTDTGGNEASARGACSSTAAVEPGAGREHSPTAGSVDQATALAGAYGWWSPILSDCLGGGARGSVQLLQPSSGSTSRTLTSGAAAPEIPSGCNQANRTDAPVGSLHFVALLYCLSRRRLWSQDTPRAFDAEHRQ